MMDGQTNRIYLYGPPASGKTTLGGWLAERLQWEFIDLDAEIVRKVGHSIPELFASKGEMYFRAVESETLRDVGSVPSGVGSVPSGVGPVPSGVGSVPSDVGSVPRRGVVVALGGGTLLNADNRMFCEQTGTIVTLSTPSPEELERRLGKDPTSRPLGNQAEERAAHYASFPNRIAASFEVGPSLVIVGTGIATAMLANAKVVVDAAVAKLYGSQLPTPLAVIASGEKYKTPETVMKLWHAFAQVGLGRSDLVTAVGGGVTGDLTGFAAATWMRGVDWINVPTTLLSMVDASTGGKTGCDLPEGKNLAGAFHPPRLVIIDTVFLSTLTPKLIAAGRAEMIKHAIIGGMVPEDSFKECPTAKAIAENLQVKADIVRADPLERLGRRILLNCGHTIGHAVEKLSDYRCSHGEAVAIGCVAEARLAVRLGLAEAGWPDELAAIFAAAGLPVALPSGIPVARLVPVMMQDKKKRGKVVEFALPCGWGRVRPYRLDLTESFAL